MDFKKFSAINWARCIDSEGFNMYPEPLYLIAGITEELGEVAGIIKKLQRGFNKREQKKTLKKFIANWEKDNPGHPPPSDEIDPMVLEGYWYKGLKAKLSKEVADVFTYLDLFSTRMNLNFPLAVAHKFNEVSEDMECPKFKIPITQDMMRDPITGELPKEVINEKRDINIPYTSGETFPEDKKAMPRTEALIQDHLNKNKPE